MEDGGKVNVIESMALSPDGKRLGLGNLDGNIAILQTPSVAAGLEEGLTLEEAVQRAKEADSVLAMEGAFRFTRGKVAVLLEEVRRAAGLEEPGWTPDRLPQLQRWITERGGAVNMNPAALRLASQRLREAAVSSEVDVAMNVQRVRTDIQAELYQTALQEIGTVQGTWTSPESPAPLVFLFEDDHVAWAPFVAQAGAPVGVIVENIFQADGMKDLFKDLGIPEARYKIVSLDIEIDRISALRAIRQHFQRPGFPSVELVPLPGDAPAEEIEQILRRYGLRFDTSPMPRLIVIHRYLAAEA